MPSLNSIILKNWFYNNLKRKMCQNSLSIPSKIELKTETRNVKLHRFGRLDVSHTASISTNQTANDVNDLSASSPT